MCSNKSWKPKLASHSAVDRPEGHPRIFDDKQLEYSLIDKFLTKVLGFFKFKLNSKILELGFQIEDLESSNCLPQTFE